MKKLYLSLFLFLSALPVFSQIWEPVRWDISVSGDKIIFAAAIETGWHIYDLREQPFGPNPTVFTFERLDGAQLLGNISTDAPLLTAHDRFFRADTSWFEGNPTFTQKLKFTDANNFSIEGRIDYTACHEKRCVTLSEDFSLTPANPRQTQNIAAAPAAGKTNKDFWRPVIDELNSFAPQKAAQTSWLRIFLLSFGGGILALFMPCVWPVIPLTVSFFLKRQPLKAAADAAVYGLSILIIYLAFGLAVTLLFGAAALNNLATNATANIIFFVLLVLFALSLFGAFEMRLPAAWVNKINAKSQSSAGIIGIFFMAFTLVLVSFSCTGPIIGALLVKLAAADDIAAPAIGMFGFGLALALPFAALALFPSVLKKLPKSGGWMDTFKVILGFLELALAFKFLSVADLAYHWGILNRDVFLVLWIANFTALGFYLLRKISPARLFLAAVNFAFVIYMLPGLWGAPLKMLSAFLPPLYTQKFKLYESLVKPQFEDYDEGMLYAQKIKKPVMIDFSGYGCVNCRRMEAAVLSHPRVREIIDNDYVLIMLHVDDRAKLPQVIEAAEGGKKIKLRTAGDKWSLLQRLKFGANAQPFYVLLDNDGNPLAASRAYGEDIAGFADFLKSGLKNYKPI